MTQANFPFVTGRDLRDASMHTAITNAEAQVTAHGQHGAP